MPDLNTDVRYIKGIGEQRAKSLQKLGIFTLRDLVSFFPKNYEDRTVVRQIATCLPDETVCITAMVLTAPQYSYVRKGMDIVKLRAADDTGAVEITFFNQKYVRDRLVPGEIYVFYGKLEINSNRFTMTNPIFEHESDMGGVTGRIMPIYRLTAGISQKLLASAIRKGLDTCGKALPDYLPDAIREEHKLVSVEYAYENIHFPDNFPSLAVARQRLIFEELFVLSCALGLLRGRRVQETGTKFVAYNPEEFFSGLPFIPTGAQRQAIKEAFADMCSGIPMNRLIQGDVGSGKTLVAAACIWLAWKNGKQSAFMAPTEILASQHQKTLSDLLCKFGMKIGILTSSMSAKDKRKTLQSLSSGELNSIIGTHALLGENVLFDELSLVITDEQHRFGVGQRGGLSDKGTRPHTLVMSATPIPRTLALIIYGDLDVSVINELPPGRQKVDTFAVGEDMRQRVNGFIRKLVGEGRQVFIVCPMVEENDTLSHDLKSVEIHAKDLETNVFPDLRVACIHGRMKPNEKSSIMSGFISGDIDILVSTTVIEVGVDVPNAALMIVENADRFGLSQLHQLRGRVGRGSHKSYCILISDSKGEDARHRLKSMQKTTDGFKIAEEDLKLRGPGDFFGSRQHGLPEMRVSDLCHDMDVLQSAQSAASRLLGDDPKLQKPANRALSERIHQIFEIQSSIFN